MVGCRWYENARDKWVSGKSDSCNYMYDYFKLWDTSLAIIAAIDAGTFKLFRIEFYFSGLGDEPLFKQTFKRAHQFLEESQVAITIYYRSY